MCHTSHCQGMAIRDTTHCAARTRWSAFTKEALGSRSMPVWASCIDTWLTLKLHARGVPPRRQHAATHSKTLQHTSGCMYMACPLKGKTLQHTATHCITLQHTATHCNTLATHLRLQAHGVPLRRHHTLLIQIWDTTHMFSVKYYIHKCDVSNPYV